MRPMAAVLLALCAVCVSPASAREPAAYSFTLNGEPFTPPAFYHSFKLSVAIESSGDDEWYGFKVDHNGYQSDHEMINEAKALKIAFDEGKAEVSDEGVTR